MTNKVKLDELHQRSTCIIQINVTEQSSVLDRQRESQKNIKTQKGEPIKNQNILKNKLAK